MITTRRSAPANHLLDLVRAGSGLDQANPGLAFTPLNLAGALGGDPTIDPEQVLSHRAFEQLWPHVRHRSRAGLSRTDSWGGIKGTEQFRSGYPAAPNPDQEKFDRQVAAMNPDLTLTVPVRIVQAADDERVRVDPAPLLGTDALVEELTATNSERGNIHYRRYEPGAVPADEPLGIHFATIDHDTPELTEWLAAPIAAAADG